MKSLAEKASDASEEEVFRVGESSSAKLSVLFGVYSSLFKF